MTQLQSGQRVQCFVERVHPFGVFVRIEDTGAKGYIRRRDLDWDRLKSVDEIIQEIGKSFQAEIIELPRTHHRFQLSRLPLLPDPWETFVSSHRVGDIVEGVVYALNDRGALIQLPEKVIGQIDREEFDTTRNISTGEPIWTGDVVEAVILSFDASKQRVKVSIRKRVAQVHRATNVMNIITHQTASSLPVKSTEQDRPTHGHQSGKRREKQILILDDASDTLAYLSEWLKSQGFDVVALTSIDEARKRIENRCDDVFLVDIHAQLTTSLDLIHSVRNYCSHAIVIVMSDPDSLEKYAVELDDLGVHAVIAKPLDIEELERVLDQALTGEFDEFSGIEKFIVNRDNARFLATTDEREGFDLVTRLIHELKRIVKMTGARTGFVFHQDKTTGQYHILAEVGAVRINRAALQQLAQSPVNDVIEGGGVIFEKEMSERQLPRFEKLLKIITFESCIGVPIESQGRREHALFLFHPEIGAFNRFHVRDAQAMALVMSSLIEQDILEKRVHALSSLFLAGQLSSCLTHELSNKAVTLELISSKVRSDLKQIALTSSDEMVRERQASVLESMDRLVQITKDLRETVSLFQKLKHAPKWELFSVAEVIEDAYRLLKPEFDRNKVRFHFLSPDEVYLVRGSKLWLYQALLNIMLNAVQQMAALPDDRSRELSISLRLSKKARVQIRISDTGPGIHKRLWKRIFHFGFTTRHDGSGLGLYIARNFIRSMHGELIVERSVIPLGTTFLIELPLRRPR